MVFKAALVAVTVGSAAFEAALASVTVRSAALEAALVAVTVRPVALGAATFSVTAAAGSPTFPVGAAAAVLSAVVALIKILADAAGMTSVRSLAEAGAGSVEGLSLFVSAAVAETVFSGSVAAVAVLAVHVSAAFTGTVVG